MNKYNSNRQYIYSTKNDSTKKKKNKYYIKNLGWKIGIIIAAILLSLWAALPLEEKINLGLDLKGGMQLVMKVEVDKALAERKGTITTDKNQWREQCIRQSIETIRDRVDKYGVKEAGVQRLGGDGEDKILVSLPGVDNPAAVKDLVKSTAVFAFKAVAAGPFESPEAAKAKYGGKIPDNLAIYPANSQRMTSGYYVLNDTPIVTGDGLKDASTGIGPFGSREVRFELANDSAQHFRAFTAANIGKPMAIVFDHQVESVARINDVLSYNSCIRGNYTAEEAHNMVLKLKSGALAAPMTVVKEQIIGPSLGSDSVKDGMTAVIIGLLAVMAIMVVYYRTAGINAVIALMLNILLLLAAMAYMGFTLTLPGIAGIILTIGMAVDANVLIFERIREEIETGASLRDSIDAGFKKAFVTVLDANLTTVIAAVLLMQLGSGPIKGFAVTLIIGIIASMFTALFVSKIIFQLTYYRTKDSITPKSLPGWTGKPKLFKGISMIPFMNNRIKITAAVLSLSIILAGGVAYFNHGFNQGIDFSGGMMMEVDFQHQTDESQLRGALAKEGLQSPSIQEIGTSGKRFLIKTVQEVTKTTTAGNGVAAAMDNSEEMSDRVAGEMKQALASVGEYTLLSLERVGPMVGAALKQKVAAALTWALLGMLLYIGFRFKWTFGAAAVLTLIHDVLVCLAVLALFRIEISLPVAAALMTVIGYSLNDTIVIFDRVRANLGQWRGKKGDSINTVLNESIGQTLSRTLMTSCTTLAAVVAFWLLGGQVLAAFSLTLLVGILVGTYSSIFQSCAWLSLWKKG